MDPTDIKIKIDLVSAIISCIGLVVLFARNEMKIRFLEKQQGEYKIEFGSQLTKMEAQQSAREVDISKKFESLSASMMSIMSQLGRVEGKLDTKH